VLCEKPLAMDARKRAAMIDAPPAPGRVGMTAFNWRFSASMLRFHEMVAAGHVGRPFHLGGRWLGARWADESAASTWRMDRAQAGHGAMGDMGVHLIDLVRWSFGDFRRVSALGAVAHPSRTVPGGERAADAEDYCAVLGSWPPAPPSRSRRAAPRAARTRTRWRLTETGRARLPHES
jgi:predicted dehydrogenase